MALFRFIALMLVVLTHKHHCPKAELIEDSSQCSAIDTSPSAEVPVEQWFYHPSEGVVDFTAVCVGAETSALPKVQYTYSWTSTLYDFEETYRFNQDDCGYIGISNCCMIDPTGQENPDERNCDATLFAHCKLFSSPEDQGRITCESGILVFTSGDEYVFTDEGYLYFASDDASTSVVTQADGSHRFTPGTTATTATAFVAGHANTLVRNAEVCDCFPTWSDFPSMVKQCLAESSPDVCPTDPAPTGPPIEAPTDPPIPATEAPNDPTISEADPPTVPPIAATEAPTDPPIPATEATADPTISANSPPGNDQPEYDCLSGGLCTGSPNSDTQLLCSVVDDSLTCLALMPCEAVSGCSARPCGSFSGGAAVDCLASGCTWVSPPTASIEDSVCNCALEQVDALQDRCSQACISCLDGITNPLVAQDFTVDTCNEGSAFCARHTECSGACSSCQDIIEAYFLCIAEKELPACSNSIACTTTVADPTNPAPAPIPAAPVAPSPAPILAPPVAPAMTPGDEEESLVSGTRTGKLVSRIGFVVACIDFMFW